MVYPLVWLFLASFKANNEVFSTSTLLPGVFRFENYIYGWKMIRPFTFTRFYQNTFLLVVLSVMGSLIISLFAGYGFARMKFPFKPFWTALLFITIMLPNVVTLVPKYIIFSKLGWLNSFLPFAVPSALGVGEGGGFFIFLMAQFIRGMPVELDEASKIDGCGIFHTIVRIIAPLAKPAMFSVCIFAFIWNWDNFQNQLIFITELKNFTVSLALRTTIDVSGAENWGAILSMATCSVIPAIVLFFSAQKYFVEGIVTTGIKG
jgi:ABC-type glycerol-3-phosphate transport system permease component